jgi:hypothetical protein
VMGIVPCNIKKGTFSILGIQNVCWISTRKIKIIFFGEKHILKITFKPELY